MYSGVGAFFGLLDLDCIGGVAFDDKFRMYWLGWDLRRAKH